MQQLLQILNENQFNQILQNQPVLIELLKQMKHFQEMFGQINFNDQLQDISTVLSYHKFKKGEVLFHMGDKGDKFYMIVQGAANVYVRKGEREIVVENQLRGQIRRIGEYLQTPNLYQARELRNLQESLFLKTQALNDLQRKNETFHLYQTKDISGLARQYWNFDKSVCLFQSVATINQYDCFGETCYMQKNLRSATIVAATELHVVYIYGTDYQRILSSEIEKLNFTLKALENIFKGMKQTNIVSMSQRFQEIQLNINNTLFQQGDFADQIFIVQSGSIEIRQIIQGQISVLSIASNGQLIGHEDLFSNQIRSFTAIAGCESIVCSLHRDVIEQFIDDKNLVSDISVLGAKKMQYYLERIRDIEELKTQIKDFQYHNKDQNIDFQKVLAELINSPRAQEDLEEEDQLELDFKKQSLPPINTIIQSDKQFRTTRSINKQAYSIQQQDSILQNFINLHQHAAPKLKTQSTHTTVKHNNSSGNSQNPSMLNTKSNFADQNSYVPQQFGSMYQFKKYDKRIEYFDDQNSLVFDLQKFKAARNIALTHRKIIPLEANMPIIKQDNEQFQILQNEIFKKDKPDNMINFLGSVDCMKYQLKRKKMENMDFNRTQSNQNIYVNQMLSSQNLKTKTSLNFQRKLPNQNLPNNSSIQNLQSFSIPSQLLITEAIQQVINEENQTDLTKDPEGGIAIVLNPIQSQNNIEDEQKDFIDYQFIKRNKHIQLNLQSNKRREFYPISISGAISPREEQNFTMTSRHELPSIGDVLESNRRANKEPESSIKTPQISQIESQQKSLSLAADANSNSSTNMLFFKLTSTHNQTPKSFYSPRSSSELHLNLASSDTKQDLPIHSQNEISKPQNTIQFRSEVLQIIKTQLASSLSLMKASSLEQNNSTSQIQNLDAGHQQINQFDSQIS